jgi:uncharacterized protein DUF2795
MAQDFIDIQRYLAGISYPATKEQLIEHAKEHQAPKDVLEELERVPEGEYDGPNRVSSAVAHI